MRALYAIEIVPLLLLLLVASSAHPQPGPFAKEKTEQSQGSDSQAAQQPNGTANPTPTVNQVQGQNQSDVANDQAKRSSKERLVGLLGPRPIVAFNGLLVLFTFFLVVAGGLQAWLFRKAMRLEQRPWVVPAREPFGGPSSRGVPVIQPPVPLPIAMATIRQRVGLELEITNTGRSPAIQVTIVGRWAISKPTDPPPTSAPKGQINIPITVIGPGLKQAIPFGPLPADIYNRARIGNSQFWVYGQIRYKDVFRRWRPYTTKFCFWYDHETDRFLQQGPYNDCT
jgi:hypothetical protein